MKEELFEGFFSDGAEFWIGKVVDIELKKHLHKDLVGDGDIRCVFLHILK